MTATIFDAREWQIRPGLATVSINRTGLDRGVTMIHATDCATRKNAVGGNWLDGLPVSLLELVLAGEQQIGNRGEVGYCQNCAIRRIHP